MTRRITYVASRWGEPSQTFVRREAAALAELGVSVETASLKKPAPTERDWSPLWLNPFGVALGVVRALIHQPGAVLGTLITVSRRSALRNLGPQLLAACIGIAWVGSRRLQPGHMHSHFGWVASTATWAAARVDGRSFSVVLHAFEIHDARLHDRFTAVPLQDAVKVFVISERDRAIVADRWGVAPVVARVGVPSAWLDEDTTIERQPDLVVAVGRLVEKKGFPVLIESLAATEHPWRLQIIGDGPEREALQEQVHRLGLAERVTLSGAASESEVRAALCSASVLVAPSVETRSGDRDGIPTVLMEAMACGAAVAATDAGAIAELVDGVGLMVSQGDSTELADALNRLWDPEVRGELAALGRARVAKAWTVEATGRHIVSQLFET